MKLYRARVQIVRSKLLNPIMFQVIKRNVFIQRGILSTRVRTAHSNVKIPDDKEYQNAIPFEKLPGPKALPLTGIAHHFMPGGQFYKKGLIELQQILKERYGEVVIFKGTFGKPDFVFLFNPKDIELVFRTEGKWPYRTHLEVLDEFRTKERPDLFQGIGGLLQE